jgi:hypothetical protein
LIVKNKKRFGVWGIFMPFLMVIITVPIALIGIFSKKYLQERMKYNDLRVENIKEIYQGIRLIKF